jgi:hypothetical protein
MKADDLLADNLLPKGHRPFKFMSRIQTSRCRLTIAIFGLFDQFEQTCDFRLGTGGHQMIELIFRQIVLQILHHVEVLPPAIQDFKTGLLVVTAYLAIIKWYGVAQSWATPYQS